MLLDGELGRGKEPQFLQAQKGKLQMKGVRKFKKTHLLCPKRLRNLKNILLSENKQVSPKHKPFWFLTNMLLQSARLLVVSVPISCRIHAELCRLGAVAWLAQGQEERVVGAGARLPRRGQGRMSITGLVNDKH